MQHVVRDDMDMAAIEDLRSIFTEAELDRFLSVAIDDLDVRPRLIERLISHGDIDAARAEAHRLKGGMMYFGSGVLVRLAERLEVEPEHALPAIATRMVDAGHALSLAIQAFRR